MYYPDYLYKRFRGKKKGVIGVKIQTKTPMIDEEGQSILKSMVLLLSPD